MKPFITAALAGTGTAAMLTENDLKFVNFIAKHNKNYNTMEEYNGRKARFLEIDAEINRLNTSQTSSRHAHNSMSDWTQEEFQSILHEMTPDTSKAEIYKPKTETNQTTPDWMSWCYYSMCATYVKNYKGDYTHAGNYVPTGCKASYAFAAISVLETNYRIREGNYLNLSEQQVIDCSDNYGNFGCNGGDYMNAFNYLQVEPMFNEEHYPYRGQDLACQEDPAWWQDHTTYYSGYVGMVGN